MRRLLSVLVSTFLPLAALSALPKVAVLDALISGQMDPSVIVPVTEKVAERIVASGEYLVLDRGNIESILHEREFQFSGLVSDSEISQAGKFLGAEYVVVIRIETIGDTYFISSKMISVETGIISRQASAEGEGKLSVLLDLAGRVGALLTGKSVPQATPVIAAGTDGSRRLAPAQTAPAPAIVTPSTPPATEPVRAPPSVQAQAKPAAVKPSIGRIYLGGSSGTHEYEGMTFDTTGFDVYMIVPLGDRTGMSMSLTFADGSLDDGIMSNNFDLGLTFALPVGPVMPWASIKAGYAFLDTDDYDGFEYGWDAGVDLRLGIFAVGARYQVQYTTYVHDTLAGFDAVTTAVIVMVGVAL